MNPFDDDNLRVIGCEFRVRDAHSGQVREVAMLPLDVDLPDNTPPHLRATTVGGTAYRRSGGYSFPLTIHTSRGDINVEAWLP